MPKFNKRQTSRGYSKSADPKTKKGYISSEVIINEISREQYFKEKYSNPIPKTKGPRQQIIDYVNMMEKLGKSPSVEEIIEYMQKIMKNADRNYIQNLIDQVRTPTIIAYYIYRSSNASNAIKDIANKYPDINRLKVAKIIRKYKVNPNSLTKTEKAQVKEALSKIITETNKEKSRADGGEDRQGIFAREGINFKWILKISNISKI